MVPSPFIWTRSKRNNVQSYELLRNFFSISAQVIGSSNFQIFALLAPRWVTPPIGLLFFFNYWHVNFSVGGWFWFLIAYLVEICNFYQFLNHFRASLRLLSLIKINNWLLIYFNYWHLSCSVGGCHWYYLLLIWLRFVIYINSSVIAALAFGYFVIN